MTPKEVVDKYTVEEWSKGRTPLQAFLELVDAIASERGIHTIDSKKKWLELYGIAAEMVADKIHGKIDEDI